MSASLKLCCYVLTIPCNQTTPYKKNERPKRRSFFIRNNPIYNLFYSPLTNRKTSVVFGPAHSIKYIPLAKTWVSITCLFWSHSP